MPERTLVAVHGNFASRSWWADLLSNPPDGWQVLAPNLPGFAGTPHAGPVSIRTYAAWLADWLREQAVNQPVLLGHSLGGAVVLEYASRHAEQVAGLILAASAPLGGLVTPEENYPVLELMRGNAQLLETSLGALFPSGKPANFDQLVQDAGQMAKSHYSGNARALAGWQVDAAKIRGIPTLVLGGELDKLVTPDMVRAQAEALSTQAVTLQGRGHGFPQEDPAAFKAELQAFLSSLPNAC